MKYTHVLFDLDGTLTDPGEGITNSVMYALNKLGIEERDRTKLYKFIGPPLANSFKEFYGFSDEKAWQGVELYREYFGVKGLFENRVYDGMYDLLDTLKEEGVRLYVATSKPTHYTLQILEKFNLSQYFDLVSGCAMNEKNSDKSAIIQYAVDTCSIPCDKAIMVGDRLYDIKGAKVNNIDSVGVLFGYGSKEELMGEGATYIAETPEDILKIARGDWL